MRYSRFDKHGLVIIGALVFGVLFSGCSFIESIFGGPKYLVDLYNEVSDLTITDVRVYRGETEMEISTDVPGRTDGTLPSGATSPLMIAYELAAGDYTLSATVDGVAQTYTFTVSGQDTVAFYSRGTSKSPITLKNTNFDQSITYSVPATDYTPATGTLAAGGEATITLSKEEILVDSIDYVTWNDNEYYSPDIHYEVTSTDSTPVTEVTFSLPASLVPAGFEDNTLAPVLSQTVDSPTGEAGTFYNPYRKATITNGSNRTVSSIVNTGGFWTLTQTIVEDGSVTFYLPLRDQMTTTYNLRVNFSDNTFLIMGGTGPTATKLTINDDATTDTYTVAPFGTVEVTNSRGFDVIGIKVSNQFWLVGDPDVPSIFTIGTGMADTSGNIANTIANTGTKSFYLPAGSYSTYTFYFKQDASSTSAQTVSAGFSVSDSATTSITLLP